MQVQMIPTWQFCRVVWEGEETLAILNELGADCWETVGVIPAPPECCETAVTGHGNPSILLRKLTGFRGAAAEGGLVVPGMQLSPRPV